MQQLCYTSIWQRWAQGSMGGLGRGGGLEHSSAPCGGSCPVLLLVQGNTMGWHQASPLPIMHWFRTRETLPSACESMPAKDKCSGGRREEWSRRSFAFRKVSVKEINVLYYTGHMKSLSPVHHLHYTSLEPSEFWSLNLMLFLHYLGTV